MNGHNPAGRNLWFVAFDTKTGDVAGMVSVMPKLFYLDGQPVDAGIMGDFVVAKKYRVFGPAMGLPKIALSACKNAGLRVIYTLPNQESEMVVKRAGFDNTKVLGYFVKPVSSIHFLKGCTACPIAVVGARVVDLVFRLASLDYLAISRGDVSEESSVDGTFDVLWETIKKTPHRLVGDHSAAYLHWRYFCNPLYRFRVITLRRGPDLAGYMFFAIVDDRVEVYDIVAAKPRYVYRLVGKISDIARKEHCKALCVRLTKSDPMVRQLRLCLFLNGKDDVSLLVSSTDEVLYERLGLSSGDRNI